MALMILNLVVDCIRRKSTSRLMAFIGLAVSLILLLVRIPSDCEQCSLAVLQIGLVMVARLPDCTPGVSTSEIKRGSSGLLTSTVR